MNTKVWRCYFLIVYINCDYVPDSTENYDALLSLIKKMDIRKKDRLSSFMKCVHYFYVGLDDIRFF